MSIPVILKSELADGDKSIKLRTITTGITKIEIITNALFIIQIFKII
jgi:hypothetical protein